MQYSFIPLIRVSMEILSIDLLYQQGPVVRFDLSFEPYLRALEAYISKSTVKEQRQFFESVRNAIKDNPALRGPITDLQVLDQYEDVLNLLELNLFPLFPRDENLEDAIGLLSPVRFFSYSDGFKKILFDNDGRFRLQPYDIGNTLEENHKMIYREILSKCYGISGLEDQPVDNLFQTTGKTFPDYYRITINKQFVDIKVDGELPPLKQEWLDYATDIIISKEDIPSPMPLEQFRIEGFFIFTLKDVTEEEALHTLRDIVANMHTQSELSAFQRIRSATRSYLGNESLDVGIIPIMKINRDYVYDDRLFSKMSIVFRRLQASYGPDEVADFFRKIAEGAGDKMKYTVYQNICTYEQNEEAREILTNIGLQSLALFPVWHQQNLLGFVELGSENVNAIMGSVIRKMDRAIPLFREFIVYQQSNFRERMDMFVKERYTAIQPSVSWKFNETAWHALQQNRSDFSEIPTPAISFEGLYPFYGAVDIRNSSHERSLAVRTDFLSQLHYLSHLFKKVSDRETKEELSDVLLQVRYWQSQITDSLTIEQEADLTQFLEVDSVQLINTLREKNVLTLEDAADYNARIASGTGVFYRARNSYEDSLQQINAALKNVLDEAEDILQAETPHYLEKFKTDGWEYSLYTGQSIAPWLSYDVNTVAKVQNWQLRLMVDMAIAANKVKQELIHPLSTTQLVLAHMHPVDIRFRIDEKRFDVEGAYSIRYEVIKKRIDKAYILNSEERLTQPGTIAIVYAHSREAAAYRVQLQQLIKEGRIFPEIDYFELEKMQGVTGLKAMRVLINMEYKSE